jgi:asparagine synthase (glutamine-hydrolysing)
MCGIVGIAGKRADADGGCDLRPVLQRMTATIAHRGPDDDGFYTAPGVGLGMRRLSIIDLGGGHQPIANEDKKRWIVFNGEIYNYRELRPELTRLGHEFQTHSDTETIIHAFEEFGASCVHRFNGMFGFAIWDADKRTLFLARDRLGVKPLYYFWDGDTLVFASEIKAILASGLVRKELDPEALWHYLTFRYVPAPLTMWRGIRKLPPGHTLTYDAATRSVEISRYWDIPYDAPVEPLSDEQELEQFTERFLRAVRYRLIADVPVGIFLSGGLDSSAVAAAVNEVHNTSLKTFSVAFDDGGRFDETPYARGVAERLGTDHHEVRIGHDEFVDFLPEFVWFSDEPIADPASVPLYYVSRLAAQHVKVVLSGEGADEVLAGYTFERTVADWERLRRFQRWPRMLRSTLPDAIFRAVGRDDLSVRLRRRNLPPAEHSIATVPYMTRYFSSAEKRHLWPGAPDAMDSDDVVRAYYERAPTTEPLHQMLYAYCQDWLVEDLLMKADKMTMATSLELRVPFLDYQLVEWLARRPARAKVRRDASGRWVTKYLLRRFCETRVPRDVLERSKEGFPVPLDAWVAGTFGQKVREELVDNGSWVGQMFDRETLRGVLDRGRCSPQDAQRVWLLYVLELWARRWL